MKTLFCCSGGLFEKIGFRSQDITISGIIKSTISPFRVGVLKGGGKAEYACVKKQFMHKYWYDGLV